MILNYKPTTYARHLAYIRYKIDQCFYVSIVVITNRMPRVLLLKMHRNLDK